MNKKGFTLIELLTVIAILGILVLLAAPKFLGYTEKANIAKIQTGIKAVETAIDLKSLEDPEFTENLLTITPDRLQEINDSGKLIDKNGFIKEDLEGGKNVPLKDLDVKWNSGGEFIVNHEDDSVYYYNKDINVSKNPDGSATIPGDNNGDGSGGDDSENTEPEITYPITHENGDKEDADGTITKPDGTVIKPDGTIIHPNGDIEKDGVITKPNGDKVHPNGDIVKPNGDVVKPNGDIEKPNGDVVKPNGDIVKPNGDTHKPNGDIVKQNGDILNPDGTVTHPDGSISTKLEDGSLLKQNGDVVRPDGTVAYLATDSDFTWTEYDTAIGYTVPGKPTRGYYKYTGDKKQVVIPSKIEGFTLTEYFNMFKESDVTMVVNLNKGITRMQLMFVDHKASSLDLSLFDTSSVTNMEMMFGGSTASLNLSGFDTREVLNMTTMFYSYEGTSLDLSSFDTSKVTDMSYMFSGAKITSLDLSNFNTSEVKDMDNMFQGLKLTILNVENFNTTNVESMSSMFKEVAVDNLDLTSFVTNEVKYISGMFERATFKTLDLSSFELGHLGYNDFYTVFSSTKAEKAYANAGMVSHLNGYLSSPSNNFTFEVKQ